MVMKRTARRLIRGLGIGSSANSVELLWRANNVNEISTPLPRTCSPWCCHRTAECGLHLVLGEKKHILGHAWGALMERTYVCEARQSNHVPRADSDDGGWE